MVATNFVVPDVSAEHVMDVAKLVSISPRPLPQARLRESFDVSAEYVRRAVIAAEQLGFVRRGADGELAYSGRPEVRYAKRAELPTFLRERLQNYPPFVFFCGCLVQGYDLRRAVAFTRAVFDVASNSVIVSKTFTAWGAASDLLGREGVDWVVKYRPVSLLEFGTLRRLQAALENDWSAKNFVMSELGVGLVADLHGRQLDYSAISDGLLSFEKRPDEVCGPVANLLESYLASLQSLAGAPLINIAALADSLLKQGRILRVHRNVCYGAGGFRNASSHGSDPDTGQPWQISSHAALVGVLLTMIVLRSLYQWVSAGAQEL